MFGIFNEIKVFSVVLATSTIFFTIAIIHIVHDRVGSFADTANSDSPDHSTIPDSFLGAISTVYLIMGGRFDPLNSEMYVEGEGDIGSTYKNAPLVIMAIVYFTFSSILMLNVLIALINNAFVKADDRWKQVWLENRLRYVEIAENMSYHISGFRETLDWFPKEIYYTATPYQKKQYWLRVARTDEEIILEDDPIHQSPAVITTVDTSGSTEQSSVAASTYELEEKLTEKNQSLLQDIEKMDQGIIEANKEVSRVKDDLAEMKMTMTETNGDVFEMKVAMAETKRDVAEMKRDISEVKMAMTETKRDVFEMKMAMTETKRDVAEMRMAMTETKRGVSDIKGEVVKIQSDVHAILEALRGIQREWSHQWTTTRVAERYTLF